MYQTLLGVLIGIPVGAALAWLVFIEMGRFAIAMGVLAVKKDGVWYPETPVDNG